MSVTAHEMDQGKAIRLEMTEAMQPPADIAVVFRFAPEQPMVGRAGKQAGDILLIEKPEGGYQITASLGKKDKANAETVRRVGGSLGKWLLESGAKHVDLDLDSLQAAGIEGATMALCEGLKLGAYRFRRYKQNLESGSEVQVTLRGGYGPEANQAVIQRVRATTEAVMLARDLAHEPANTINPVTLAEQAETVAAQSGLKIKVFTESDLAEMGAGAILAVGQGSRTPARMIVLEYAGNGQGTDQRPVVLVGKAITFDTGGYSLKASTGIVGMKYDKCGGVDVLAVLQAAAALKLETPVVGIIGAAENMISAEAYRPDDIITSLSGKTIEIISTDAEGRLVLADALTYAQRNYEPRAIIDMATLTGGVVTALGRVRAGLMSNSDDLTNQLLQAGEKTYERLWRLPLDEDYLLNMKGDDADLKNSGGREGHPVLGGAFLNHFIEGNVPWAHLDIAGVADTPKDLPYSPKGATGFGVRLILEYLSSLTQPEIRPEA